MTVYLDLVEQEGWNMPVLHYSASDPNATIFLYQQLLANTSGAPIRWPKTDPNDYAKFLDRKITSFITPDMRKVQMTGRAEDGRIVIVLEPKEG